MIGVRTIVAVAIAVTIGTATYALTATNSVPPSSAGQGAGAITSYVINSASYTLDANSPQLVTNTTLTLNAPTPAGVKTVRAKISASGAYAVCTLSSSTGTTSTWSCSLSSIPVTQASSLNVAAAQ